MKYTINVNIHRYTNILPKLVFDKVLSCSPLNSYPSATLYVYEDTSVIGLVVTYNHKIYFFTRNKSTSEIINEKIMIISVKYNVVLLKLSPAII